MAGESGFCNFKIFQVKTLVPICHRTRRQSFQPHQWHPRGRPWGQTRPQAHPLDRRLDGNGTVRKQGWRQNTSASTVIELNLFRFNPSVCKPRRFNRGSSGPWRQEWVSLMKIFFVILSRVLKFNAFCSVHFGEVIMSDIFFIWGITIHSIHFNMYYIHIFIFFNINNLQVLCIYCYSSLTNITKKGIWQEPLWEMPSSKPSSLNWVAVLNVEKSEIEMMHSKK